MDVDHLTRRVVLSGEEARAVWDVETSGSQRQANVGIIEHTGQGGGIRSSCVTSAGPTLEGSEVRIVGGGGMVAEEEDLGREWSGQPHAAECALGEVHDIVDLELPRSIFDCLPRARTWHQAPGEKPR